MATRIQQQPQLEGEAGPQRRAAFRASRESLLVGGVLLVTAAACLRSIGNGFVLDDQYNVITNHYIGQWSFLSKALYSDNAWYINTHVRPVNAFYRPIWLDWYWLNYRLFGVEPAGWHAASVLVHLLVVWLVYKIAERLTGQLDTALLAALLFGLLPVHAETVAWTAAVEMPLQAAFELAAFYAFMMRRERQSVWWPALALYAGALLTHESAVIFPALIAVYVFLFESPADGRTLPVRVRLVTIAVLPFAAEAFLYLIVHRLVIGFITRAMSANHLTGAQALTTMPAVLATYLRLLVIPWAAGPAHRLLPPASIVSPDFWMPAAMLVVVGAASVWAAMNSPRRRLYLFCSAWIGLTFAPAVNLTAFRPEMLVQDRYLYLPSVGWCLIFAVALAGFARRSSYRRLVWTAVTGWLIACSAGLWNAQQYWHDDMTLSRRGIQEFPEAPIWHAQLGNILAARNDLAGATRELEKWRSLNPVADNYNAGRELWALGLLHARSGRTQEAQEELARGLELAPSAPAIAYATLARLYEMKGDLERAARELGIASELHQDDYGTLYDLGRLHARMGRTREAAAEIGRAVKLMPHPTAAAYTTLAELYDLDGDEGSSEAALKTAESIPDATGDVGIARARIKMRHGDTNGAEKALRDLTDRHPNDQRVWTMLGLLLTDQNRDDEALAAYQRSIGLAPQDPRPYFYAARLLHAKGRDREALEDCHKALAIDPNHAGAASLMNDITRSSARP